MRVVHFMLTGIVSLVITASYAQSSNTSEAPQKASKRINPSLSTAQNNALEQLAVQQEEEDAELKEKIKEQRRIELENALFRARLERELAGLRAEIERLRLNQEARSLQWEVGQEQQQKEHVQAMLELNRQKERLMAEVAVSQAKLAQTIEQFSLASTELQNKVTLLKAEAEQLRAEIDQTKARKERTRYADGEPVYLKEPLRDGTLVISDRCIDLNGIITPWKANYITDRIRYFNNKDNSKPIFIVINESPGGSVMAGSYILKAMENSRAPVYVVVKAYAASMAADITTLATKSYAYPNAVILHHQPWTFAFGNVRELKEGYEELREWWRRLGGRVAHKMGVSLDKLDKLLYEKSARGDWTEFADKAKKLKWVDHVIEGIDDSAIREMPDASNYTFMKYLEEFWGTEGKAGQAENGTIYLPPLGPKDFYYLYNPDNRYQLHSTQ